jgi:outer membrane biosynthesis protein TonB
MPRFIVVICAGIVATGLLVGFARVMEAAAPRSVPQAPLLALTETVEVRPTETPPPTTPPGTPPPTTPPGTPPPTTPPGTPPPTTPPGTPPPTVPPGTPPPQHQDGPAGDAAAGDAAGDAATDGPAGDAATGNASAGAAAADGYTGFCRYANTDADRACSCHASRHRCICCRWSAADACTDSAACDCWRIAGS